MNKSELIDAVADASGVAKGEAQKVVESFLDTVKEAVGRNEKVAITGFGNFELRERSARTGRNPQTGEEIQVAASKAPAFKPAKAFKDAVNS